MSVSTMFRHGVGLLLLAAGADVTAQTTAEIAAQQLQLQQQRERAQDTQAASNAPDVRLPRVAASGLVYPQREAPCFPIQQITLEGADAAQFQWALEAAADARGRCLGTAGVNVVLSRVQNALISAGFVTSRVVAAPQDLRAGTLALVLVPGRIRAIRFGDPAAGAAAVSTSYRSAIPARPGDLLNLRDVEQGLENFKRVPTAEADIQMVPGSNPGESDLVVAWRQGRPWRLSFAVDDGGSEATGKYQANATLSVDNPLGVHDLFYASVSNDLNGKGQAGSRGTRGHALHYSLPFGYWLLAASANDYDYRQSVAGASQSYLYSGTSANVDLKLSRVLYRDAVRKVGMSLRAFQRTSKNYIEDTEVEVQRRRMGGFELGLNGKQFVGSATVNASVALKRGTGAFGRIAAPEEMFGEGTSRPRLINADVSLSLPFTIEGGKFDYQGSWRAQWNRTPLVPQDRFAIGGRYTVRGFDGESSLSAEHGWLVRNDFAWNPAGTAQQLYLGIDYAEVGGPSSKLLLGTRLGGAVVGLRGQWTGVQYDLFIGKPLTKHHRFQTSAVTSGFNLSYQY